MSRLEYFWSELQVEALILFMTNNCLITCSCKKDKRFRTRKKNPKACGETDEFYNPIQLGCTRPQLKFSAA